VRPGVAPRDARQSPGYARAVSHRNFADPSYEPTDEDLLELAREAFAGVREANERALQGVHAQIAARRVEVLARLRDLSR
jgi:hypothetical protein